MYYKRLSYSVNNYLNLFDNIYTYFNSLNTYSVLLRNCGTSGIRKELFLSRNNKFFSFSNTVGIQKIVSNLGEANNTSKSTDTTDLYGCGAFTACLNNEFDTNRYYGNQLKTGDNNDSKLAVFAALPNIENQQIDIELYSDKDNYNFFIIFNFFIESNKYTQTISFGDMFNGLFNTKEGGYVIGNMLASSSLQVFLFKDYNNINNITDNRPSALPFLNTLDNFNNSYSIIANIKFKNGNYLTRSDIAFQQYLYCNFNIYHSSMNKPYYGDSYINSLVNEKNGLYFLENLELHSAYEIDSGVIQSYAMVKTFNFGLCNNAILIESPYRKVNDKYYRIFKTCHSDKNNRKSNYHRGMAFWIEITKEEYEANV